MLEVKDLSVVFNPGTIQEKTVLSSLCFTLNKGDFVTIIGSNGAGKSTLFQAISGAVDIAGGEIVLNDKEITHIAEYKRSRFIGRLFQNPLMGTAPSMTIEENLSLASQRGQHFRLSLFSHKQKEHMKTVLKRLDLGLEDRLDTKVGTLSGGQRQALALLMATYVTPELLLLDEHTAALDPKTAKKVLALSSQLIEENEMTALMITHNMEDALKYGNKTMIMKNGKILTILEGEERENMTIDGLIHLYSSISHDYDDRMLLQQ